MDWKDLLKKAGISPTQLEWRWMKFKGDVEQWGKRAQVRKEQVSYRNKVCQGCGNILDFDEVYCNRCSTRAPSWEAEVMRKTVGKTGLVLSVTTLLLGAIILNEVVSLALGSGIMGPSMENLLAQGAMAAPLVRMGEWWRMISAGYLHIGFIHLLFNCSALLQCGRMLESELGSVRFFTIYTLCLLGGSAMDFVGQHGVSAGASGAIFGLIGVGVTYAHLNGATETRNFFLQWAAYGVIFAIMPKLHVDNWAHAGGFLTGLVMGAVVFGEGEWKSRLTPLWQLASTVCLLVTLVAMGLMGRNIVTSRELQTAQHQLSSGNFQGGLMSADQVLKVDPKNRLALDFRAVAHINLRQYQDGVTDCDSLIAQAPDDPRGYDLRSVAWFNLQQYDKTVTDTQHALEYGPPRVDLYVRLANAQQMLKHDAAASDALSKGISLEPDNAELYALRGSLWMARGNMGAAELDLNRAAMLGSENAKALLKQLNHGDKP